MSTPYAERPDVKREWCTCPHLYAEHDVDGEGAVRGATDPDCKLHGDNPAHALPESI